MLNLFRRWYERHFSQPGTIEFALVLISAFLIVYYLMWLVGPIVVALCIAYCLDWPVKSLQNLTGLGRRMASTIVMLIFCSIVILITVLIVPQIVKQGAEFYNSIISFSLEAGTAQNKGSSQPTEVKSQNKEATPSTPQGSLNPAPNSILPETSALAQHKSEMPRPEIELLSKTPLTSHQKILDGADSTSHVNTGATAAPVERQPTLQDANLANGLNGLAEGLYAQTNAGNLESEQQSEQQELAGNLTTPQVSPAESLPQPQQQLNNQVVHKDIAQEDAVPEENEPDSAELGVNTQEPEHTITVQTISDSDHSLNTHNETASIAQEPNANGKMQIEVSYDNVNKFKLTVSDFDTRLAQEAYLITLNLPEPIPSMLSVNDIKQAVRQVRIQTTAYLAELMRTKLMPSVVNLFTWAVYIIIVPIFTFLMLYNKEQLTERAVLFILPNNQILMRKFWPSLHKQISGYIRGKILHIIIISIANSLAFKLLNVNYALLLGVGVGLSVVIPYVGAVIIAIPVVLVAIFQFGFSETFLWVILIYTVIQLLDSNVLTPMLFSKAMNLDAFSILAAILIFGGLWGFWGVFFAIPLATFIKTIVMQWPNKDVREQQKREHLRLINEQKAEKLKKDHV